MQLNAVSVDLSKTVFQLSITNRAGKISDRRRLNRSEFQEYLKTSEPIRLVMEGCATCHHWGRVALGQGHEVKILHPRYVKPYVRRSKTDAGDADALIRADRDKELFAVAVKSEAQQALQSLHTIRTRWVKSRTGCMNELRSLFCEFGIVLPRGCRDFAGQVMATIDQLPQVMHKTVIGIVEELLSVSERVKALDVQLKEIAKTDVTTQSLMTVPGVGVMIATATVSRVPDIKAFRRGRSFSSWLGLTAREHSSGQKRKLGRITKAGDTQLRVLYIHGGRSVILAVKRKFTGDKPLSAFERWVLETERRIGHNKAAVAVANKMARMVWALSVRGGEFDGDHQLKFDS